MMWLIAAAAACGPKPEKAGDECDPKDGCPSGLVCAADAEGSNICFSPPGAACDPKLMPEVCLGDNVCGDTGDGKGICGIAKGGKCDPTKPQCAGGLVCAELEAGGSACYPPVIVSGMVFDAQTTKGIAGANVIALDDQATAMTDVAVTDASGNYKLDLPVPRGADGTPVTDLLFTLRASGKGYQTFPGGLRTALPISTSDARTAGEKGWTISTTLTSIALIALPQDQQGLPSISGKVVADADKAKGVLVVAEDAGGKGLSGIADRTGAYTIFNVPAGSYTVRGYAAGLQLTPATAMMAGTPLTGIDLKASSAALGKVTGSVSIVNAPGGSQTSVVLVVASTFNDTFVRGEVPRGLRTPLSGLPNVTGAFTIDNVPEGSYVVLAGFENDGLVRDPDPNIAGTQIVTVKMPSPGMDVALASTFKITEALEVFGPGVDKPEAVTSAPARPANAPANAMNDQGGRVRRGLMAAVAAVSREPKRRSPISTRSKLSLAWMETTPFAFAPSGGAGRASS